MRDGAGDSTADSEGLREERALVAAMLAGDERAMEDFADGYFPGLYRFARARLGGDAELARDLVQTTVCKALAKLASYRGEAPLAAWLRGCCRHEIAMHFRRRETRGWVGLDEAGAAGRAADPRLTVAQEAEDRIVRQEEARAVHSTLDALPAHYARALEWKYLDRLPVEEIAARLRVSPKAAESLLSRARGAFRSAYQRLSGAAARALGGTAAEGA